jgi:hypothetical protein
LALLLVDGPGCGISEESEVFLFDRCDILLAFDLSRTRPRAERPSVRFRSQEDQDDVRVFSFD